MSASPVGGEARAGARRSGRPPLAEVAYRTIKRLILDNALPPGTQVLEGELTGRLEMSRTPVREALVRLENEHLVEIVPRHGMRVLPISADDMREIYDVLCALETMAVDLIARRGETADLVRLEQHVGAMERALAEDDLDGWAAADEAFHRSLAELAGNRRLGRITSEVRDQTHRVRALTLRLRPRPDRSTAHHRALVAALRAGDAARARAIHWDQRQRSGTEVMDVLRRYNLSHL